MFVFERIPPFLPGHESRAKIMCVPLTALKLCSRILDALKYV